MKKITFLFSLALIATIGFGQNLLSGGNLEGLPTGKITPGSSPWDTSVANTNAQSSINNNSDVAYAGEQFINMPNDFTNVRQIFTAEAGLEYELEFFYQFVMPQGTPQSTDGIFISIRQNTGGNGTNFDPPIQFYLDPSIIDGSWQAVNFDFTAPQANLLLFITKQTRAAGGPNNAARMDEFSITEKPLSVQDLAQFGFTIYPNPAKDVINLNAQAPIEKVEVFNLLGQQVLTTHINKTSSQINVSNLTDGVYLMKTYINGVTGTYKFVKE